MKRPSQIDRSAVRIALKLVCTADPPDWLTDAVCGPAMLSVIARARDGTEAQPLRADQTAALESVRLAAKCLRKAMSDWNTTQLLDNALPSGSMAADLPREPAPGFPELTAALIDIERRAAVARDHLATVQGRGRGHAMRAGTAHTLTAPETLCAVLLCEIWTCIHGLRPGKDNSAAQDACDLLWLAAGAASDGDRPENGRWRRWLLASKSACADTAPESLARSFANAVRGSLSFARTAA